VSTGTEGGKGESPAAFIRRKTDALKAAAEREGASPAVVRRFHGVVRECYRRWGRDFPWRRTADPYAVFVAEVMLQQTGTGRVAEKFPAFIREFPDFRSLARASTRRLLAAWKGMGYNRRALFLRESARVVVEKHGGRLPRTKEELLSLPGVGPATAGDVLVFAFNEPVVVIETNIRAAFIHVFFPGDGPVTDAEIVPLVERTMDRRRPAAWYNALMDYGAWIKKIYSNPAARSAHHVKQAPFEGSVRQVRGRVLAYLVEKGEASRGEIAAGLAVPPDKLDPVLAALVREGFVREARSRYRV